MLKKVFATCVCVVFLAAAAAAFAEDVHVTKRGKKYHKEACVLIRNKSTQKINKEEALKKGLEPCARCYKEDIASHVAEGGEKRAAVKQNTGGRLGKAEAAVAVP